MDRPAPRRGRRAADALLATLLVAAAGLGCFVCAVIWVADFDDSDRTTSIAGASAALLAVTVLGAVAVGIARRSTRATSASAAVGMVVSALPWLGVL